VPEPTTTRQHLRRGVPTFIVLAAILAVAAYLRTVGLDWDEGRRLHPDERFLCMVENALEPVSSLREYLDTAHSPLNPNNRGFGFFVYGHFPIIVIQYLGRWFDAPNNQLDQKLFGVDLGSQYDRVYLLGRGVSAVCDVAVTLLVFLIGARIYGRAIGLLAALLYAGAVLPIQQAHFFTVDAMASAFVALAFWSAVRATARAHWLDDVLFGFALGAGLACKVSIFPVIVLVVLAVIVRHSAQRTAQRIGLISDDVQRTRAEAALAVRSAISFTVVVLVSVLTFRLLQPYAFIPPFAARDAALPATRSGGIIARTLDVVGPRLNPLWMEQMSKARAQQVGDDDSPPNHQWAARTPLLFSGRNLVEFGLGWPFGVAALLGWLGALIEGLRGRGESWRHVLPAAWIGFFFAWFGSGWVMSMRYLLPLYPVLALSAAWLLIRIAAPQWDASLTNTERPSPGRQTLGIVLIALTLAGTFAWAVAFTGIYRRPHTRIAASRWMYENIPADVTLTIASSATTYTHEIGLPDANLEAAIADQRSAPVGPRSIIAPNAATTVKFTVPRSGQLTRMRINDVRSSDPQAQAGRLTVELGGEDPNDVVATCTVDALFPSADNQGPSIHSCDVAPSALAAGRTYVLRARSTVPLMLSGTPVANEGDWDDALPIPLPEFEPVYGRYRTYGLNLVWEDDNVKRRRLQHILDRTEYLTISSNRFYASLPRNPRRWPMTIEYYRALFSGELGFELVADFNSTPTIAGLRFNDQSAEEAFTVYDHPRVLIFRKRDAYDSAKTAVILQRADLMLVKRLRADQIRDRVVPLALPALRATPTTDANGDDE
jgi:hypothetical protein